ncbi:MAG: LysR family transcriptional regulator [Candidatus Korobacteraceae bacterium]|jgi:DNA-binding transcriptional LysR family regulator
MKKIEPSLQTLKLLAALATEGKLRKAARRLGMSQSAASHALSTLERNLSAALFVRNPNGLRLSETGTHVLPHVRKILDGLDAVRAEVSGLAHLQTGTLRVASVPTLAATIVPRLISEYNALYPGIEVSLFEGTDDEVRDWVLNGVAQVGFAALPVPGLRCQEVTHDEWLALVPAGDFARREKISLAALSRRNFLVSGGGCEPYIQKLFEEAGLDFPSHRTVKQLSTIQAMVAENLGVSLVPSLSVAVLPRGTRSLRLAPRKFRRIGLLHKPINDNQ